MEEVLSLLSLDYILASTYILMSSMELEQDIYDVVIIGTGLAESIAAAYVRLEITIEHESLEN